MDREPSQPADVAERAQRLAERTALRKVRGALDQIQDAEGRQRRVLRRALVFCAVLLVLGLGFIAALIAGGKERRAAVELPSAIPLRK